MNAARSDERADVALPVGERVSAVFDPRDGSPPLADLALDLFRRQKVSWSALAEAYSDLANMQRREIDCGDFSVFAQFNPRRIGSSGAAVDAESLRKRPCFLCLTNLPPAQRAILYRESYLVLCNPAPIFPEHFTIVHLGHFPQSIEGHITDFLLLTEELAPRFSVFYNGPRCGASAPDHLHFQAIPAGMLPVDGGLGRPASGKHIWGNRGAHLFRTEGLAREIWIVEGRDRTVVAAILQRILTALAQCIFFDGAPGDEPMLNLLGTRREGMWRAILFPRRKHRPAAFYREGEARLVLTPAAVEMGGLLITPREGDYRRLDAALVREIYEEVSLDKKAADCVLSTFAAAM